MRTVAVPDELLSRHGQIFFARDVFAPTAARLAAGTALQDIGEPLENVTRLDIPTPRKEGEHLVSGQIIHVDRFGNLLTNVHQTFLDGFRVTNVDVGHFPVGALSETYAQVAPGKPLALFGSTGYLEIAYHDDRADTRLGMGEGIVVAVTIEPDGA